MSLTVRDLLGNQFAAADPLVLAGRSHLGRTVEWVHSSEIFEISPLLFGGEVLLTTGLGLAGVDAGTRRHYLREIGARDIAGIAIELGRTFDSIPADMVEEASRLALPLIALRAVVPFIDLCRSVNTRIVSAEVESLRTMNRLARELNSELTAGNGIAHLPARVSAATGCPLVVTSGGGALVAMHGLDDDRSAWTAIEAATVSVPIVARDGIRGTVTAGPGSPLDDSAVAAVLEHSAASLALAMTSAGTAAGRPRQAATALISDLLEHKQIRAADLTVRAGSAGFHRVPAQSVIPIAIDSPVPRIASRLLDAATTATHQPCLHADVHATTFGIVAFDKGTTDPVGNAMRVMRESFAGNIVDGVTVVVGDPGEFTAAALSSSLNRVRAGLRIATLGRRTWLAATPVTSCRDLAVELTVDALPADRRASLVSTTIAPLVAWDAGRQSDLTRTLEVYLRHGASATRCAAALHLGRQSLYQRLDRIRALLGFDPSSPAGYGSLLLALCAHRLAAAEA